MNRRAAALRGLILAAGVLVVPFSARAETVVFTAGLSPASEVPPKKSNGTGTVQAVLDTKSNKLHYVVNYKDLTGDATGAHFHGPAQPGQNAGISYGLKSSLASPIEGDATLTPEQAADLAAGKWYFNVHTAANPSGEIRGQLLRQ
ncbi:MAG: CHRD domain-containing protein [Burkholderiaceae bacterium]|jgi:hypothetical protein